MLHAALFTVRNGCVLAENEHKKENRVVHARVTSKLVKNSATVISGAIMAHIYCSNASLNNLPVIAVMHASALKLLSLLSASPILLASSSAASARSPVLLPP